VAEALGQVPGLEPLLNVWKDFNEVAYGTLSEASQRPRPELDATLARGCLGDFCKMRDAAEDALWEAKTQLADFQRNEEEVKRALEAVWSANGSLESRKREFQKFIDGVQHGAARPEWMQVWNRQVNENKVLLQMGEGIVRKMEAALRTAGEAVEVRIALLQNYESVAYAVERYLTSSFQLDAPTADGATEAPSGIDRELDKDEARRLLSSLSCEYAGTPSPRRAPSGRAPEGKETPPRAASRTGAQ
jgi:hypothetical protein